MSAAPSRQVRRPAQRASAKTATSPVLLTLDAYSSRVTDNGTAPPDYRDINLDGIHPHDARETLRLIESAAHIGREGGNAEQVNAELESTHNYAEITAARR